MVISQKTEAPSTNHATSAKTRHGVAEAADPTAGSNPGSAQVSFTASLALLHRTTGLDFAC